MKKVLVPALALLTAAAVFAPAEAEAQWRRGRGNGAAIGAGIAAGVIGGALIAGAASRPAYAYGEPVYVAPRRVYVEEPVCYVRRVPVVDRWGEVVAVRRQRVCE
jgi:predicted secreted Zn-dependent protease